MTEERLISARELAEILGYSENAIKEMARRDVITGYKFRPRGQWRFRLSEVLRETKHGATACQ